MMARLQKWLPFSQQSQPNIPENTWNSWNLGGQCGPSVAGGRSICWHTNSLQACTYTLQVLPCSRSLTLLQLLPAGCDDPAPSDPQAGNVGEAMMTGHNNFTGHNNVTMNGYNNFTMKGYNNFAGHNNVTMTGYNNVMMTGHDNFTK